MESIAGKVALVAGGASGIGLGTAQALVDAGASVMIADIDADEATRSARSIAGAGGAVLGIGLDVADPDSWASTVLHVETVMGPIDILVNSAGIQGALRPLADIPLDRFRRMIDVTLYGFLHGVQCVIPRMKDRGGHIVAVASMAGMDPVPSIADYSAAKFAVVAMAECLARELAADGIGISIVCPGRVRTNLSRTTAKQLGEKPPSSLPAPTSQTMEPIEVGRIVCDAIRANRLYVFTHPENKPRVAERFARIVDSFDVLSAQK